MVAVAALLITAGILFFRGDGSEDGPPATRPTVSIGDLELTVGAVLPANAGLPVELPAEIQHAVMATVGTYVDGGLVEPMREGAASPDVSTAFAAATAPRLDGPDRAALFDEGLPEVTSFEPRAEPVIITALSDGTGAFVLVTVTLLYEATLEGDAGTITINRTAELTLAPEGPEWKIVGYDLGVIRDGPGVDPAPTTAVAS